MPDPGKGFFIGVMEMLKLEKGTFSVVPIKSIFGINPYQQIIYVWLCHYANGEGQCWPSINTLAKACGISKDSVIKYLKELEKNGFIIKNARNGDSKENFSNLYTVIIKEAAETGGVAAVEDYPSRCERPPLAAETVSNYNHNNKNHLTTSSLDFPKAENPEEEEKYLKIKKPKKESLEIPYQQIADLYNQIFMDENLASIQKLTETRKSHIRKRWQNELKTIEEWERYFLRIKKSDFLCGRRMCGDGRPFFADFDWVINESNCIKILEDKYSNVRYENG